MEVLCLAQASSAVSRISLWTRDGLVHDDRRGPAGERMTGLAAVEVLGQVRGTPLSRLHRMALASRLADTVERLERAGLAHPALHDMAALIEQDLGPLPPSPVAGAESARREIADPQQDGPELEL